MYTLGAILVQFSYFLYKHRSSDMSKSLTSSTVNKAIILLLITHDKLICALLLFQLMLQSLHSVYKVCLWFESSLPHE